jgi:WD40 repeat protein
MANKAQKAILLSIFAVATVLLIANTAQAQFWHVLPPLATEKSLNASFSQDEKQVFYLAKSEAGIANIYRIPIKGGAPVAVTTYTNAPIVRAFHFTNRPYVAYMQAKTKEGTDYHIYRVADDGKGGPLDLTPTEPGVENIIIGASYNGMYIYYTSNKENRGKIDVYRYDTQQFVSELVFPNDKDYQVLAWTRDHMKLLVLDPGPGSISLFDVVTTQRQKLADPYAGGKFDWAVLDPSGHSLFVLETISGSTTEKQLDIASTVWKTLGTVDLKSLDYSPNGKFLLSSDGHKTSVKEIATQTELGLPNEAEHIAIAPKETLVLYTTTDAAGAMSLHLYDITKKTTLDLVTVK